VTAAISRAQARRDALGGPGNSCDEVDLAGSGHTTDLVPGGQWWSSGLGPFLWRSLNLGS